MFPEPRRLHQKGAQTGVKEVKAADGSTLANHSPSVRLTVSKQPLCTYLCSATLCVGVVCERGACVCTFG